MDQANPAALKKLLCPNCKTVKMNVEPNGRLFCPQCNKGFKPPERLCPICGQIAEQGAEICQHCGTELARVCTQCGARNWSGANLCYQCNTKLELVGRVAERLGQTTSDRLLEHMHDSPAIKDQEEKDSQRRMNTLWDKEHERQRQIAAKHDQQKTDQVRLIRLAMIAAILLILTLCIMAVFFSVKAPAPLAFFLILVG